MSRPLSRVFASNLRIRDASEDAGDGRTLVGLAVPFDVQIEVSDGGWERYDEIFRKGAFAKTIKDRPNPVKLCVHHLHRSWPIGKATSLAEEDDGLHAEFHLTPDVPDADVALALVKDGVMTGLSIGFDHPAPPKVTLGKDRTPPSHLDLVERTEGIRLHEVSLVNFPAYEEAGVSAIRDAQDRHPSLAVLAAERGRSEMEVRTIAVDRWGRVRR